MIEKKSLEDHIHHCMTVHVQVLHLLSSHVATSGMIAKLSPVLVTKVNIIQRSEH